jgi:hypothetical protein
LGKVVAGRLLFNAVDVAADDDDDDDELAGSSGGVGKIEDCILFPLN